MNKPLSVHDYRELARRRLPRMVFDYLEGGADDEHGLKRNRDAFRNWTFRPRRLTDVSRRDISTMLFGERIAAPLLIAPTGLNSVFWPNGDVALARAAERAGIPFILSSAANATIEHVADAAGGQLWFQLYVVHRTLADQLVDRALQAGYKTLVLTTDVALNGKRERDLRNGFAVPFRYTPRIVADALMHPSWSLQMVRQGMPELANFASKDATDTVMQAALMKRQMDASFAWDDLQRLRERWPHRLLVKGLLDASDAVRCAEIGVDGVIVSNHGGRQLDDAPATIEALPAISAAVSQPVLVDSGFRRGSDIVKALALGAGAVLLGRAALYGLAARGESGVDEVIALLQDEIDRTLAMIGCPSIAAVTPEHVSRSVPGTS